MLSTIRSKLFLIFFSLGLLPLLISIFFAYHTMSDAMMAQSNEQVTKLVDKTAEQIQFFFETREKEITLLSNYPFIQLSFLQFEFGQRLDKVKHLLRDYENKNRYFNNIYLTDLNGNTILAEPENKKNILPFLKEKHWVSSIIDNDIKTAFISKKDASGSPVVVMGKLVYDFEDSASPTGMIVFDINLSSFTQFVASVKIGTHGYACLWDHQGHLIFHPQKSIPVGQGLYEENDDGLPMLIERMIRGEKGQGNYEYQGIKKQMLFTPCNVMNWSVSISLEKSELMADIIALRYRMLSFCAVITFLIIIASYAFGKSISNPISHLINGARAIGDGEWEHFIRVDSGDELQSLANEFNKMTSRLKKSINEIIELKNFNDDILRSVPSGIITIDQNLNITSFNANAAKILQIPLTSRGHSQSFPDAGHFSSKTDEILHLLKACVKNNTIITNRQLQQFSEATHEDSPRYIELNTSFLKNSREETVGAIAVIKDITERKKIDEEMIRVDRLASLGELSAGMAHEIRNPLAGMKTATQILAKNVSEPSGKVLIQGILNEIQRLNKIVTDLLNFSKPKKPLPSSVDLSEVIKKSLALVWKPIKNSNIELKKTVEDNLPDVFVDREQIEQIFLNLLLNALKAMPEGGTLSVSLKKVIHETDLTCQENRFETHESCQSREKIKVVFQDTGHGIKEEILSKIFNPFFTTDPGGTGLGLSIVQKLLEKNKGDIDIESKKEEGTRVILTFPAMKTKNQIRDGV